MHQTNAGDAATDAEPLPGLTATRPAIRPDDSAEKRKKARK